MLHYDVTAYSRTTFQVLHDYRGLSVHFMLDVDGTIYQTLDLKERAYHAGTANSRSVCVKKKKRKTKKQHQKYSKKQKNKKKQNKTKKYKTNKKNHQNVAISSYLCQCGHYSISH